MAFPVSKCLQCKCFDARNSILIDFEDTYYIKCPLFVPIKNTQLERFPIYLNQSCTVIFFCITNIGKYILY